MKLNVLEIRADLPVDAAEAKRRGIHADMCRLIVCGPLEVVSAILWSIRSDDIQCLLASREKSQPPDRPDMIRASRQYHSAIQVLTSSALEEALRSWRAEQLFVLVGPQSRCVAALDDLSPGLWKPTPIDPLASLTQPARGLVLTGTYDGLHGGIEVFGSDETVLRMFDVARVNRHPGTSRQ